MKHIADTAPNQLGIIQSRGLGDILIALPIANHYRAQGWAITWPICEQFYPSLKDSVPWVNWVPIPEDSQGAFFYDRPQAELAQRGVEYVICLYQSLTGHPELAARQEFQITKFDQLKYAAAGVPFLDKWRLAECVTRDLDREASLERQLDIKQGEPYVVVHVEGSDHRGDWNPEWIPEGWRIIELTPLTDCLFDWLGVLERAEAIVSVDSAVANLVDQMRIADQVDSYFIPRSHIHQTPVLGCSWTTLDPGEQVRKRITLFRSS